MPETHLRASHDPHRADDREQTCENSNFTKNRSEQRSSSKNKRTPDDCADGDEEGRSDEPSAPPFSDNGGPTSRETANRSRQRHSQHQRTEAKEDTAVEAAPDSIPPATDVDGNDG